MKPKKIELLAPAGNFDAGRAAIDCGADAVYMGGPRFGARRAAGNTVEDIARLARYAHLFNARLYVTLNTVIFEHELAEAERTALEVIAAGADALIVQDMAFTRMGLDGVELHASTQMCNMTPEHVRFLEQCGFTRVILERSLSLGEIEAIRAATSIDLECFVHGAICVGHSGQCYLSRSMSGRSGNRGECSQPCRLAYDLLDDNGRVILQGKHLLSVMDMNLTGRIPDMLAAGITSFKIEGRLKDLTYVKNITSHYRTVLDNAMSARSDMERSSAGKSVVAFTPDPQKSFQRGATEYFIDGKRRGVASFDTPKSIGEALGRVRRVGRDGFELSEYHELNPGDGICFHGPMGFTGTNINSVSGERIVPNRLEGLVPGTEVFRNYDHRFTQLVERSKAARKIDAKAEIIFNSDSIKLIYTDIDGIISSSSRAENFPKAQNPDRCSAQIASQVSKSGDTPFRITQVSFRGDPLFAPASVVNDMRREALTRLADMRMGRHPERVVHAENPKAAVPQTSLPPECNVTNSLAASFYRDHGAAEIARAFDLRDSLVGERVMTTSYCLRRELGECLRENPRLKGGLRLRHGNYTYRLDFDCRKCQMNLICETCRD